MFDLSTRQSASRIAVGADTAPGVMTLAAVNGRDVAAAWFEDGTLRAWDLETAAPLLDGMRVAEGKVTRLGIVQAGGQVMVACAGERWARGWSLHNGQPAGPLVMRDGSLAETIAFCSLGDRVVAVEVDASTVVVMVIDLVTGERLPQQFKCNEGSINAIAVGVVHGRQLVAASAGTWNCAISVWDLESGEVVAGPLAGHTDYTPTIALGLVHGRPVLVSGSQDSTLRVWELDAGSAQAGRPPVFGVGCALARLGGRRIVLASNGDGTVHVLDSETGEDAAPALRGHTKAVGAIATVMLDGGTVVVTSGWDETVRSWQLETSAPLGGPWAGHGHWVLGLDTGICAGTPVAVSGGQDGTIRIWELEPASNSCRPSRRIVRGWTASGSPASMGWRLWCRSVRTARSRSGIRPPAGCFVGLRSQGIGSNISPSRRSEAARPCSSVSRTEVCAGVISTDRRSQPIPSAKDRYRLVRGSRKWRYSTSASGQLSRPAATTSRSVCTAWTARRSAIFSLTRTSTRSQLLARTSSSSAAPRG